MDNVYCPYCKRKYQVTPYASVIYCVCGAVSKKANNLWKWAKPLGEIRAKRVKMSVGIK